MKTKTAHDTLLIDLSLIIIIIITIIVIVVVVVVRQMITSHVYIRKFLRVPRIYVFINYYFTRKKKRCV